MEPEYGNKVISYQPHVTSMNQSKDRFDTLSRGPFVKPEDGSYVFAQPMGYLDTVSVIAKYVVEIKINQAASRVDRDPSLMIAESIFANDAHYALLDTLRYFSVSEIMYINDRIDEVGDIYGLYARDRSFSRRINALVDGHIAARDVMLSSLCE